MDHRADTTHSHQKERSTMSVSTVSTASAVLNDTVTDIVTPIDDFITDTYDRIEAWENGGARRELFEAEKGEQVTVAYDAFFNDMRAHMAALEEPGQITGRHDYGPEDLLVDMRHLRDLNKNLVRSGREQLVRRFAAPAVMPIWTVAAVGNEYDSRIVGVEAADTYQGRIDAACYRLAKAIKDTTKLEREMARRGQAEQSVQAVRVDQQDHQVAYAQAELTA